MDYQRIYNAIISKRKLSPLKKSPTSYTESHHIIPRCLGGNDSKENLIRLTGREHFVAHRLLAKIHPNDRGLAFAVFTMRNLQDRRVPSKTYELLKKRYCESASESMLTINSDPEYAANKSKNASLQWGDEEVRSKMMAGILAAWDGNDERKKLISERVKSQMKCPSMVERSLANIKKANGDSSWNSSASIRSGCRPYWGLAGLLWRLSEFNPDNKGRHIKAVEFSRSYDCGQRQQIYQRMISRFRKGWVPHKDPLWMRDFGDEY